MPGTALDGGYLEVALSLTAVWNGYAWQFQTIDDRGGSWYTSMKYGPTKLHISYEAQLYHGLAYAWQPRPAPPPTLQAIENADGDGNYLISWNALSVSAPLASTDAITYTLEEAAAPTFSGSTLRYEGSNTQFQVSGQPAGAWYYRVRATGAIWESSWSTAASACVLPASPSLAAIDNPSFTYDYAVSWAAVAGATGYTLEESSTPDFATPAVRYSGPSLSFQVARPIRGNVVLQG